MTKHKYSTIALIMLGTLLIIGAVVVGISTEDLDVLCSTNGATLLRTGGTWACSVTSYGEIFIHNETTPKTIAISDSNTWYDIDGLNISNCLGITCAQDGFTLDKDTIYSIDNSVSFTGGANGEYHFAIFLNGIEQIDCGFLRTMGGTATLGVATKTCLKDGDPDDTIAIRVKDLGNPAQNIDIYSINVNIVQIT